MKSIILYTTTYCPHCFRAKKLLETKKIVFKDIDITNDDATRDQIQEKTGWMTVPMIFIGDDFIGGADELFALDSSGDLDKKLQSESKSRVA